MGSIARRAVLSLLAAVVAIGACRRVDGDEGDDRTDGGTPEGAPSAMADTNPGPALPADAAWVKKTAPTTAPLRGVWLSPDGALAVAVGDGGAIVVSTDRGETWTARPSGSTAKLWAVWGSGADDVYAVGDAATVLHSTDRGATWIAQPLGATTDLRSVWGSGADNVFAGGEDSSVYRTRNSGATFVRRSTPAITRIASIWGASSTKVYAVAQASVLLSESGGDKFSLSLQSLTGQNGIWVSPREDVYVVNEAGVVRHWLGNKQLHETQLTPVRALMGVWGTGPDDVYVVGARGRIAHTSTQGEDWNAQDAGVTDTIRAIHGAGGVVLAVGDDGVILKRSADVRVDAGADASASDAGDAGGD